MTPAFCALILRRIFAKSIHGLRLIPLKHESAADDLCLMEFFATEAVVCAVLMLFIRLGEFQRASGKQGLTSIRRPKSGPSLGIRVLRSYAQQQVCSRQPEKDGGGPCGHHGR